MNDAIKHLFTPENLIALIIAVAGAALLSPLGRFFRAILMLVPNSIKGQFKKFTAFAPVLEKAKTDLHAATVLVGAQLGKMLFSCWLSVMLAGCAYVVATLAGAWPTSVRTVALGVLALWFIGCVWHIVERLIVLLTLRTAIFTPPPKPAITIGNPPASPPTEAPSTEAPPAAT